MTAAGPWISISRTPEAGRSYLISASYGGVRAYDVAFYNGRRPDGSHWWTLGRVAVEAKLIDRYAEIAPDEKDEER